MPDGLVLLPETFIIVHISITTKNLILLSGCANSKVRSCAPGHSDAYPLMFQFTIFIAVLVC